MSTFDSKMATAMTVCIVLFFIGVITLLIAVSPFGLVLGTGLLVGSILLMGLSVLMFGICLTVGAATRSASVAKARSGPKQRIAAKIDRVWVTDRGRVVSPEEVDLKSPGYHVVLMTVDGRSHECDTAPEVIRECVEGSWGWAEVQGDWLGSYMRDPQLYMQYSGR